MNPQSASSTNDSLITVLKQAIAVGDYRDITLISSVGSVFVLMLLGSCLWCFTRFFKRKRNKIFESPENSGIYSDSFFKGWATESGDLGKKESKDSMKQGSLRKYKGLQQYHQRIITPDKIDFVIPTISLPAQPSSDEKISSPDECPSTSLKALSASQLSIPRDFYPQLYPEGGSAQEPPKVGFSLYYESETRILHVRLLEGRTMPEKVRHFVAVKLYPGRGGKQKTREFENVTNPTYNQEFSFHIRKSTLCTRVLKIKAVIPGVPNKQIGALNLALKDVPGFGVEDTQEDIQSAQIWKFLEQFCDSVGGIRMRVSLQWQTEPLPGLLTLKIIEATGLHEERGSEYTSSHVKVSLQEQGRHIKSRKTRLVRWGSVPVYDDTFVVTIPDELLSQVSFLLELVARGRLGSKNVLGKIAIGPLPFVSSSQSEGISIWEEMCHSTNSEIVRWLQLVP